MRSSIAFIVCVIVLTGCGSIQVKVDVLNPNVVEQERDRALYERSLPIALSSDRKSVETDFAKIEDQQLKFYDKLKEKSEANVKSIKEKLLTAPEGDKSALEAKLAANMEKIDAWQKHIDTVIKPKNQHALDNIVAINDIIKSKHALLENTRKDANLMNRLQSELLIALRQREQTLRYFESYIEDSIMNELRSKLANGRSSEEKKGLSKEAGKLLAISKQSIIGNQGLVESPYAYAVAAAPDDKWSPKYNATFGTGRFGNFDMAIKMESLGEFTIKGLSFDPTDVARVASKVTTQAVLIGAQVAGVPIRTQHAEGDGAALAASSDRLASVQSENATFQAQIDDSRSAMLLIARTILREQSKLKSAKPEGRQPAIDAIHATYSAHKSRLDLESKGE